MKSKRLFAAFLALMIAVCCLFAACSAKKTSDDSVSSSESVSVYRNETYTTTDPAVIKGGDAAELLQSYSTEELGLTESWDKYNSVTVNDSGIKLENTDYDGYYIEIEVSRRYDNGDGKYLFDTAGKYLISYDGKTLLKYDDKTGECTPIKMKSASSNQSEPAGETHTHENGEVHSSAVHGE